MRKPPEIIGENVCNIAYLALIMNDYFRCAKNNGSLKSNRKLLVIKPIAKQQLVQVK